MGAPFFAGESSIDQLVEIIKVIGTPTKEQIRSMNPHAKEIKLPQIKPHPWTKVFPATTPEDAIDLISRMLEYTPTKRITALEACSHRFFNELRKKDFAMPNGIPVPQLFDFSPEGKR